MVQITSGDNDTFDKPVVAAPAKSSSMGPEWGKTPAPYNDLQGVGLV